MKSGLTVIMTVLLSMLMLSTSQARAHENDQVNHRHWRCAKARTCPPPPPVLVKAEDEANKVQAKTEKVEENGQAKGQEGDQVKVEAKAIQAEAKDENREEDPTAEKVKDAEQTNVEIEITIKIGGKERTVKLEVPLEDFQITAVKAKAKKKAPSKEDQAAAVVPEQAQLPVTEPPARQEVKAVDEQKSAAQDEQVKVKAVAETKEAKEVEVVVPIREVAVVARQVPLPDVSGQQIDPAKDPGDLKSALGDSGFWERPIGPELPRGLSRWNALFADAFGAVNEVLDAMWRDTKALVVAMKRFSEVAQTEVQVAKQEPD